MAAFPALVPSSRSFTLGTHPTAVFRSSGGARGAARQGIGSHGHQMSLGFTGLTVAQAALIRAHYRSQGGTAETFDLPSEVTGGMFNVPLVAGLQWRYKDAPEFKDNGCGYQDADVQLVTAPCAMTYRGVPSSLGSLLDVGLGAPEAAEQLVFNGSCWIAY